MYTMFPRSEAAYLCAVVDRPIECEVDTSPQQPCIAVDSKAVVIRLTPEEGLGVLFNCHAKEMYCETYD